MGRDLGAADMGNAASIWLLLGFTGKAALFQLGIQQGRPPASLDLQRCAFGQSGNGFERFHERLRRFKRSEVQFDDGGVHDQLGFESVSSIENCFVARTA